MAKWKTSSSPTPIKVRDVKQRLKSTSKDGQSTQSRANESTGDRKKELEKISKTDKANFKKLKKKDPAKAKRIEKQYKNKKSRRREDNRGVYI